MIFFTADVHLRPYVWSNRKDISGDAYFAWQTLATVVSGHPGSVLLLGGDIFHTNSASGMDQHQFDLGMRMMLDNDIRIYGIPGNHDVESYYRPRLHGMEMLGPEPVELNGLRVCGIPWIRSSDMLVEALGNIPPCDILVTHCGFRHLLGFEDAAQCDHQDVPEHVGMVFNGHIHVLSVKHRVYSPGSLSVNSVAEFDVPHGFMCLDEETRKTEYVTMRTREFVSHEWLEGPPDKLPGPMGDRLPVMNLIYGNDLTPEVEAFKEAHPEILFLDNVQTMETLVQASPERGSALDLGTVMRDSIRERLRDSPDAQQLALDLLESENPAETIQMFVEERGSHDIEAPGDQ